MKKSCFERVYSWRYYNLDTIIVEIENLKLLTQDRFAEWQEEKKWQIAEHHFKNNDFYKQKVGEKLPVAWSDLPVVTKSDLQIDINQLITKPNKLNSLYSNNTSGSSGQPLKFVKDYYTQARVWAYKKIFFQKHGIDIGRKEARFYGIPKDFKANIVQHLKDIILNRSRFVIFEMSDDIYRDWVRRFKSTKFEYIYGYTSPIVLFCRYLIKKNIIMKNICPTLRVCVVTSETCTLEDEIIIKQALGVPVIREYGTTEVGLLGYCCEFEKLHIPEESVFIEINNKNEILVTDLFNTAFPFIRYNVGDMAEVSDSHCKCGSNNRIISNLLGRTNDVIRLPSGKISAGFTFYYISRSLLEASGVLKEFIIRQTSIDTFEFDVVSDTPLQPCDVEELRRVAVKYLEPGLNIIVNQVTKIDRPASGKLKHFYSELRKQNLSK